MSCAYAQEGSLIQEIIDTAENDDGDSLSNDSEIQLVEEAGMNPKVYHPPIAIANTFGTKTKEPILEEKPLEESSQIASSEKVNEEPQQLSFNFVYYLFYKYKLVEILDD